MLTLALVDADSIYFRIAWVVYDRRHERLHKAWKKDIRQSIDYTMREILWQTMAKKTFVAVGGIGNFRKDLSKDYKSQRPEHPELMKKALAYGKAYIIKKHRAVEAHGMEADDLVAIWAYECMEAKMDYVICGLDKDLLQIPGPHYNYSKKTHCVVNEDEAHKNLMLQCLTGDVSDNIPGIYGIGPKKAAIILDKCSKDRRWNRVKAAWRKHKATGLDQSYQLLRMLTTWEEFYDIQTYVQDQADKREQHDRSKRKTDIQDTKV